ncbi:alpha/beta fold hydrolase [Devosia rhizoryzae]|uniref:Alpha/beta hydrolase n=1 Tax=Devosia rhizoryzae TaxID=2774137 RepID=A0ABX7CEA3_9HYPH|nr:alpha/beta hydrolase [Devosia rhizoryzae]QQR40945.1 alpha/beta hydrolase [Devosia rhizoryzae]
MPSVFKSSRTVPPDHPAFATLPIELITMRDARTRIAVHRRGQFGDGRMPLVCVAGYNRNMSDFTGLAGYLPRIGQGDWPLVLIDLGGRGRSDDRAKGSDYGSLADAHDLADTLMALGIGKAIILGQGHGGQVAMALAAEHPLLVGGTILLDAGPVTDSRSIVRLRNNLAHIHGLRGGKTVSAGFNKILAGTYPGLPENLLPPLALRSHWFDKRGRARPLFDNKLIERLKDFSFDDVLTPQWPLFDALTCAPLLLLRTQLTDQVRRETFEEMVRRRPDAVALTIMGQGSPALFDEMEDVEAVTRFMVEASAKQAELAA